MLFNAHKNMHPRTLTQTHRHVVLSTRTQVCGISCTQRLQWERKWQPRGEKVGLEAWNIQHEATLLRMRSVAQTAGASAIWNADPTTAV